MLLSLERGHLTILDEDDDDLAVWPISHVHDWVLGDTGEVSVHVPEGTLKFLLDDGKAFLNKLSILHASLG